MKLSPDVEKVLMAGLGPCDRVAVCQQLVTLPEGGILTFPHRGGWARIRHGQIVASGSPGSPLPPS